MPKSVARLLLVLWAFVLPALALAAPPSTSVEQEVLDVDQAWVDAEVAGDRATLHAMLDDQFVATFDASPPVGKEQFLRQIVAGWKDATRAQRLSDRSVRVDDDTAVIVETDTISGTEDGKAYRYDARLTAVYLRRTGRWTAIALHLVRKPPASAARN